MNKALVIYHADCNDGFCAAWIARRALVDADFVPAQYGQQPPDVTGRKVYILDFCYKRGVVLEMASKAESLVVLDHHRTAAEDMAPIKTTNPLIVIDQGKSGGRLTWEHFFPGQPSPWIVDYTEDRDLWKWALPHSRAVSAALSSYPRTFDGWRTLLVDVNGELDLPGYRFRGYENMVREGAAILRYQQQLVDQHVQHARPAIIGGYTVNAVNATCLMSEIGGKLAEGQPFGATYFVREDGRCVWSLRSRDNGVDVSEIAKRYGGGGHRNAAGFTSDTLDVASVRPVAEGEPAGPGQG